jgi:N6-L-threonylcarbamoyladenine synthase
MKILSIETSCDETGIAVLQTDKDGDFSILSNIVSSQVAIHAPYGGVVPMLAKREHQRNLLPILKQSLDESRLLKISKSQNTNSPPTGDLPKGDKQIPNSKIQMLKKILEREDVLFKKLLPFIKNYAKPDIDLIAVTNGPGLEPALWVGVNFAKALAYFWNLPVIPINHVEAHITANWLEPIGGNSKSQIPIYKQIEFPIISLVVSGGHTQLILMRDFGNYKILGETRDDAAGEAFDKLARMLNLGYPGGPIVAVYAAKLKVKSEKLKVKLPRPMINSKDYDFSFSGLKTAALYFVKTLDKKTLKKLTAAICAEFQQAEIDVLVSKTIRAAKEFGAKTVLLSGGVASNDLLRKTLSLATEHLSLNFSVPPKNFCTDNAAMIALTAHFSKFKPKNWREIEVDSNLRLA